MAAPLRLGSAEVAGTQFTLLLGSDDSADMVQRATLLAFALGLDGLLLVAYLAILKNVNLFVKIMWRLRMSNSMENLVANRELWLSL